MQTRQTDTPGLRFAALATSLVLLALAGCGGSSSAPPAPDVDTDLDGLLDSREAMLGTDPANPDTDGDTLPDGAEVDLHGTDPRNPDSDADRIWDGEEIGMYGTLPDVADSDADGISDGADPQPSTPNAVLPAREHGVFTDDAFGGSRTRLTDTRYQQNHVVYAPQSAPGAPFLIYQTYLADGDITGATDGEFDESDLPNSAIAIMNVDGSRPRLLTDLDGGMVSNNGAIDATPEPSPDGRFILFASNRHDTTGFQLRLYVMGIDGSNPVELGYSANGPAANELDGDPHWGPDDKIAFKRETLTTGARYSRVYTATIDTATMMLSDVTLRTDEPDAVLMHTPGDFDPKISPDGTLIASYRHLADPVTDPPAPGDFGDYDIWVGRFSDPAQPATASITFLDVDPATINLFPRWNLDGDRLAVWRSTPGVIADPIDIVVYDLDIQASPFSVSVNVQNNITLNAGWIETMPSWNTDPARADTLVYSASR